MTAPDRPTVDADGRAWWSAAQDRKLMVNVCGSCGQTSLYARPFCPHCWGEDVQLAQASGRGRLYTWSVIHHNAAPFDVRTPYVLAMVDLAEGPRLMTVVENCQIEDLCAGMDLVIAFRDDEDGFVVPVFCPAAGGAPAAGSLTP